MSLSAAALSRSSRDRQTALPPLLARTAAGTVLLALADSGAVPAPVAALADAVTRALFAGQVRGWLLGLAVLGL